MEPNFEALRSEFPLLAHKTYLNSGSYCALANDVKAAFDAYMEDRLLVGANWDVWVMKNEAVRAGMATLLGAAPDEIAVTASASAGLNALASAFDFTGPRNKVVVSDFEFPTSAQIWHAQAGRGAQVVHVHKDQDGYIPLEAFDEVIDEETRLVAVTHVCFRNGAKLDIAGIARLAHAKGARFLLDCYQSAGSETVDVEGAGGRLRHRRNAEAICWERPASAFLYVRGGLIPTLWPSNSGWFAQENITAMDITANRPSPTARRFEAGTPPVVNCYAAEAGLNIINAIGTDAIGERVRGLTRRCLERLEAIGWPAVTPSDDARRGPMIAIRSRSAGALAADLMDRGIVASHRDDNLRVGFHFYNNDDDIETFIAAMVENRPRFCWG